MIQNQYMQWVYTGIFLTSLILVFFGIYFFKKKKSSLATPKAEVQSGLAAKLDALILKTKQFNPEFLSSLEELLYTSDLGPKTVTKLLESVRAKVSHGALSDLQIIKTTLLNDILQILDGTKKISLGEAKPWVILVVGVNGVGKTTSIGKLAQYYSSTLGKSVLIVAGDTFRAAAKEQLAVWGERAKVEVYTAEKTNDAAAVAFQGIQKGVSTNKEVIIIDTAGRLHTKENLMEELKKIKRVMDKALPGAPHETILVVDANSGQNARVQAEQFNSVLGLTSLIVTKLDGTARGGIIVGIADEVGIGVQFIGTGEKISDLEPFSSENYAKGLLRF